MNITCNSDTTDGLTLHVRPGHVNLPWQQPGWMCTGEMDTPKFMCAEHVHSLELVAHPLRISYLSMHLGKSGIAGVAIDARDSRSVA
jgi:hypothetical protein